MRTARTLLERRGASRALSVFLPGAVVLASFALASCASDDDDDVILGQEELADAAPDAIMAPETSTDAGADASPSPRDAAMSDAAARPVECTSQPCATALVTTLGTGTTGGFCALLEDGTVACWGQGTNAQLGRGADAGLADSPTPERVVGLMDVLYLDHTCAIDKDGSTWCWGLGPFLQSTTATTTRAPKPVKLPIPPARMVSVRATTTSDVAVGCAVVDTGVICWGMNRYGQVGPPEVGASPTATYPARDVPLPTGTTALSLKSLFVGNASFVLREDGTALSWGASPPLGRVSSLFPDPHPRPIALRGVSSIDVSNDNACAVAEGIAYCWGSPPLSLGTAVDPLERALPAPVATPEPVVQIATTSSVGNSSVPQRGCACGVSGDVYCWGNNASGQAGDGTKDWALTAVKVDGLPAPASQVKATSRSTCALLTNGKVYCWGDNTNGQLGNGQIREPSLVPQEVLLP
ncbi:MAG: hypothetical protein K0S65_4035 [Labilithrix sp.]|nr:hypothetical protein [Labilithrix sp.]